MDRIETTVGELVAALYDAFLEAWGDEELAELATAVSTRELLREQGTASVRFDEEEEAA